MTEQQAPLEIPSVDRFGPEVRRAALRLLAAADGSGDLAAVVAETVQHPQLHGILSFLSRFTFDTVRQCHGQQSDRATAFILDEADIAQLALELDQQEAELK